MAVVGQKVGGLWARDAWTLKRPRRSADRLTRRALRDLPDDWLVVRDAERRHIVISPYGVVLIRSVRDGVVKNDVIRGAVDLSKQLRVPGGWLYVHAVVAVWGGLQPSRIEGPNVTLTRGEDIGAVVRSILDGREPDVDTAWVAARIRHPVDAAR